MRISMGTALGLVSAIALALPAVAAAAGTPVVHPTVRHVWHDVTASANTPLYGLSIQSCIGSARKSARAFSVKASMLAISGSSTMRLRFHLFQTLPGGSEREITATGLMGGWETARVADGRHWTFVKKVTSLSAPATYRMSADFVWMSRRGRVLKSATATPMRRSVRAVCSQPDVRPDLAVSTSGIAVSFVPGTSKIRFGVTVTNHGKGASAGSIVQVTMGTDRREVIVGPIAAGGSRSVTLYADRCPGGTALIEVDPGNLLDEPSTEDNRAVASCPSP